jgi:hypothetical protein
MRRPARCAADREAGSRRERGRASATPARQGPPPGARPVGGSRAPLGLVAGRGALPLEVARAARRLGRRVAAVAFPGETDPRLAGRVESLAWLRPGEVGAILDALAAAGVREAVLAGTVAKGVLWGEPARLGADARGRELLGALRDRSDGSILSGVERALHGRGIRLLGQAELLPELLGREDALGRVRPTPAQLADAAFAWPIARDLARLDVGQTVVVKDRAVLAVEAAEGTDAAIRRAGLLAPGAVVVKLARPGQDPRCDLPAIGPGTLAAMRDARAGALIYEAGWTLVLDREALVAAADASGIAVFGKRTRRGAGERSARRPASRGGPDGAAGS